MEKRKFESGEFGATGKRVKFAKEVSHFGQKDFEEPEEVEEVEEEDAGFELEKRKSRSGVRNDDGDDWASGDDNDDDYAEGGTRLQLSDDSDEEHGAAYEQQSREGEEQDPDDDDDDEEGNVPQLEPFNMRQEMQEGRFVEGTYVWHKDEDRQHDSWLEGIGKKEMKKAAAAAQKKLQTQMKQGQQQQRTDVKRNQRELVESLLALMLPGETVLSALKRYGPISKRSRKAPSASVSDVGDKEKLNELTEIASQLLNAGYVNIYEDSYETFQDLLSAASTSNQRTATSTSGTPVMFQYRWSADGDGEVYGPYSVEQMNGWREAGYFTASVQVRSVSRSDHGVVVFGQFQPISNLI